jgi:hypothetical protein
MQQQMGTIQATDVSLNTYQNLFSLVGVADAALANLCYHLRTGGYC